MDNENSPEFITCAMDAIEQGVRASAIKEECECRSKSASQNFNKNSFTNK
jgi:hypothetical protein